MKRTIIIITLLAGCALCWAADTIYKGNTKKTICYYQRMKFYSDAACKNMIFHHPGNSVSTKVKGPNIYRFMSGGIYKGNSFDKKNCLATLVETKIKRGDIVEAKIYDGFVVVRDVNSKYINGAKVVTSYKTTRNGIHPVNVKVLYTIKDRKMYRGNSTAAKDCVLSWTGDFNGSRLLFMAINWAK